jgi:hypothetical protein
MTRRHDNRGTTVAVPPEKVAERPSPRPPAPPRVRGFWALLVLIVAGTLILLAWAVSRIDTSPSPVDGEPVSEYTGDWKDLIGSSAQEAPASEYTGDWKDLIGSTSQEGPASEYTGDWKDLIGSTAPATPPGAVTAGATP